MKKLYKYETICDSLVFFLDSLIDSIPKNKRREYVSSLISNLEDYVFIKRSEYDPEHPDSMRTNKKIRWSTLEKSNPNDAFRAIRHILLHYYVAGTQNKIKRKLEKRLREEYL